MNNKSATKVLIVDDEIDICYLLSNLLQHNNFSTKYVTSLTEATAAIRNDAPSLVLLDNHLADGMGMDYILFLRKNYPTIKVVLITAYDGHQERIGALNNGAIDFISKPFTHGDILDAVRRLI